MRYLSEKTGRAVAINGELTVKLGWHPWVEINGLSVGNAPWSDIPTMLSVERLGMRVELTSIFSRLRIPEMHLTAPRLVLETNGEGANNWSDEKGESPPLPLIGQIRVNNGELRYRNPGLRADVAVRVLTVPEQGDALAFAGNGILRGEPFHVAGQGRDLGQLRQVAAPYPLTLQARAADTEVLFDGVVVPNDPENLRGFVRVMGQDMSQLYPLLPAAIPWTPPYRLSGNLAHVNKRWQVTDLAGTVGQSDLSGTITIDEAQVRQKFTADLQSRRLDYRDLGGFVGLPPGRPAARANVAEQKRAAAKLAAKGRVFSEEPFKLDRLRSFDVDVRLRGKNVRVDEVPMDNVDMHLVVDHGVLKLDPVKIGLAGGQLVANGFIDTSAKTPKLEAKIDARNLDLARLWPQLASPRGKTGRFGGYANIRTTGNSIASMAGAANGEGALIMAGGEASTLALILTNIDLAGAVPLILGGDKTAALHCAATSFAVNDGIIVPRLLIIDTSAVRIEGDGTINLKEERYDIRLKAKSKKFSIFALRGPIEIGGTFKNPKVSPVIAPIAARIGVAAGLAALALLPFIDPGGAEDVNCKTVLKEAAGGS
jgi:uncharacterized protein involved in outer membrane biogenesis